MSVSRARTSHLRLLPVAGGAWAVCLIATMLPQTAGAVAVALWVLALGTLCAIARGRGRRTHGEAGTAIVVLLTLAAAAAAASHVALAQPARAEAEGFALSGGRSVVIEATVVGKVELRATGEWAFDAVAHRLSTGAVSDAVRFDIAVRVQPSAGRPARTSSTSAPRSSCAERRVPLRPAIARCSRSPRRAD